MLTENLVLAALKDKAPTLFKDLQKSGGLKTFVTERAQEIKDQIVTLTQEQRIREKWDKLGPVQCAAKMKMAEALNREVVLADLLEFPLDETSRPSQDETTPLEPTT